MLDLYLKPGDYALTDNGEQSVTDDLTTLEVEFLSLDFACIGALFSGDCDSVNSFQADGTIAAGDSQTCSIQNIIQVTDEPEE
jgi:hypothetical protein